MRIVYGHTQLRQPLPDVVMTVGTFDGVHRGHQAIIRRVVDHAHQRGGTAVVYSFYPPPWRILGRTDNPFLITTFEDKASLIADLGVDVLVTEGFTSELRALDAVGFVHDVLLERFAPREVLVGYDFRFGHDRRGDLALLQGELARHDATASQMGAVEIGGDAVSSTTIRRAVVGGDLGRATQLLGRHHFISGAVVRGRGRGRSIGFPTANISARTELIPAPGVYAVELEAGGERWPGVANLGYRPTFDERGFSIEAHLFDFQGDLYGVNARLHLVQRVREERRFASPEALIEQIHLDAAEVHAMLPFPVPGS
jgi:riboflavin kinase / FMN adenylyltransferase